MTRHLIVNADDFGLSDGVNRGIIPHPVGEALKNGAACHGKLAEHSEAWVVRQSLEMFPPITREKTIWKMARAPVARLGPLCLQARDK